MYLSSFSRQENDLECVSEFVFTTRKWFRIWIWVRFHDKTMMRQWFRKCIWVRIHGTRPTYVVEPNKDSKIIVLKKITKTNIILTVYFINKNKEIEIPDMARINSFLLILFTITILVKFSTQTPQQRHYIVIASKQTNEIKHQPKVHYCGQAFVRAWRVACIVKERYNLIFKRNLKGISHSLWKNVYKIIVSYSR